MSDSGLALPPSLGTLPLCFADINELPAAARFPLSCLESLFTWLSLIIVPFRGAWASELPALTGTRAPAGKQQIPAEELQVLFFAARVDFWSLVGPTLRRRGPRAGPGPPNTPSGEPFWSIC